MRFKCLDVCEKHCLDMGKADLFGPTHVFRFSAFFASFHRNSVPAGNTDSITPLTGDTCDYNAMTPWLHNMRLTSFCVIDVHRLHLHGLLHKHLIVVIRLLTYALEYALRGHPYDLPFRSFLHESTDRV